MRQFISGHIGPVTVSVECSDSQNRLIADNLGVESGGAPTGPADIEILFHSDSTYPTFDFKYCAGKNLRYNPEGFEFYGHGFTASVSGLFTHNAPCRVEVLTLPSRGLLLRTIWLTQQIAKAIIQGRQYPTSIKAGGAASAMSYSLFWFLVHCALLKKRASFIHAASIVRDNKGLLLAGTGGCGKTSTTFKLLERDEVRYLAEDFSIVEQTGAMYFNPKTISLYASDLRGQPALLTEYLSRTLSRYEHRLWERSRNNRRNPMRKVPPAELLGAGKIGRIASLKTAVFLSRGNFSRIHLQHLSAEEFADRSAYASFRELQLPSIEQFRLDMINAYREAVKESTCILLQLPVKANPDETARYLLQHKLL